WLNQVTEIPKIINLILKSHIKPIFIIDGITNTNQTNTSLNNKIEVQKSLVEKLKTLLLIKTKYLV
ncbi:MAG: hypothetical protein EBS86_17695, partial [Crocinitomicaceae bacterium]|nr:hypothetical protein [Crocinitomicaceae bacterium]